MSPSASHLQPGYRMVLAEATHSSQIYKVLSASSGRFLATAEIRYGVPGQAFDLHLSPETGPDDFNQNIRLDPPLHVTGIEKILPAKAPLRDTVTNHLLQSPVSPIGWMEGCMLEGLTAVETPPSVLMRRLETFIRHHGKQQGLEGTLPAAALARLQPDHPWIDHCLALWKSHRRPDGAVLENGRIVAESCLTVAYPLAVIARERNQPELADWALTQLRACDEALLEPQAILLRRHEDGTRVFPNWSRGLGWFLLGHALTLKELNPKPDLSDFEQAVDLALHLQAPDGLWRSFADDSACGPETSGSCAIAAALFRASELLPHRSSELRNAVDKARQGLQNHFTPDGFLGGATQHNCGGEELQRGPYRVIHPYVLGLYLRIPSALLRVQPGMDEVARFQS